MRANLFGRLLGWWRMKRGRCPWCSWRSANLLCAICHDRPVSGMFLINDLVKWRWSEWSRGRLSWEGWEPLLALRSES
jgi:hypothetical protein